MAGLIAPLVELTATELGPVFARVGVALFGGAAVAGTASLSGDTSTDATKADGKAAPAARTLPRTDEPCKKCPPEQTGRAVRRSHSMNAAPREYQGRVTGRPYSVEEGWSEEWHWEGIDFDGFRPAECLLEEAKGNYDQFIDMPWASKTFRGFPLMESTIAKHAKVVNAHPPTRLIWYFQGPKTRQKMLRTLLNNRVSSVVLP